MKRKILSGLIILIFFFPIFVATVPAFSASQAVESLNDLGITLYNMGKYRQALAEFNKVLLMNPNNQVAKGYIDIIFRENFPQGPTSESGVFRKPKSYEEVSPSRKRVIDNALNCLSKNQPIGLSPDTEKEKPKKEGLKISGQAQASFGLVSRDAIWKRANVDLNEKNWRMLSTNAYDNRENTFDPKVFDRFRVMLDTDKEQGLNFHTDIAVDPWSFTGKTDKFTVGSGGDAVEVELKYWSNTRYTINDVFYTSYKGDSVNVPEIKVIDDITRSQQVISALNNNFTIPELKVKRQFQPMRELWFDYKEEGVGLEFFPLAYQDKALSFDDPMVLSNNHIWWEESPWLDRWRTGTLNSSASPSDFSKGQWDDALSFYTRDSDGVRLTALRGLSFALSPDEKFFFNSTFASPKGLWQDYGAFDNIINATRLKYLVSDNLSLGSVYTSRMGLNENDKKDISNYLWGLDLGYEPLAGLKFSLETAASQEHRDLTSADYASKARGNAYYFSVVGAYPGRSIMDLKYGYSEIAPKEPGSIFAKYRFYLSRMDKSFSPALSNYKETRKDAFWSRHIHFREPFKYYFAGLEEPGVTWDDVKSSAIGDGIDTGRSVIGFRLETLLDEARMENLFDVRNVHQSNGKKFLENVARDEFTYRPDKNMTIKLLGIYQKMPKTYAGVDPFIYDSDTGEFLLNSFIADNQDPSLKTGSMGLEYAFTDWLALSGIWERTNDYSLAYDNYPRKNLEDTTFDTSVQFGRAYRSEEHFLYDQSLFPLPPYPYYNIFKTGLRLNPLENLEIYLDYTRNEFKSAGQIDNNMNHIGFEASYVFSKKLGFYLQYTYSRLNDITLMREGKSKYYLEHHDFFSELRYKFSSDDEFVMQYGESGRSPVAITSFDPFGGSVATLDTQHIFRLYYRRKF